MLDQERVFAILEILKLSEEGKKVVSKLVQNYFRSRKYMGAQDRKFISDVVWNILRHREKFRWHLNNINAEITTENEVILELYFLDEKYKKNITKIKNLFIIKYSDYKIFADNHFDFLNNLSFDGFYNNKMPDDIYYELPSFLLDSIKKSFPNNWKNLVLSLQKEAFFDIRINGLKNISRDKIKLLLKDITVETKLTNYSPLGIRLSKRYPIEGHKLYRSGHLEIQGEGSQIASLLIDAKPGMSVVDLCCGAGGKSLVMAEMMKNKGRILALDINQKRLDNAGFRFKKAGIHNIERKLLDKDWNVKGMLKKHNLVLIDAPCSGIGTWSRSPDSRFKFTKNDLVNLVKIQSELLEKGAMMVAPGGKLAYVVCSFLPEEGVEQIEIFKKNNLEFSEINLMNMWNDTILLMNGVEYPFKDEKKNSITLDPSIHKTDGFFISMFQRRR